jgi:tripartite-type tricarboxylate transporter receptor subunit TctC
VNAWVNKAREREGRVRQVKPIAAVVALGMFAIGALASGGPLWADESFKGKTLNIVVGYEPGGAYDHYGRLVAAHLPRHIPGEPAAIVQNMPGAGSLRATNYVLSIAPKDGTVMGILNSNLMLDKLTGRRSFDADITDFAWIGRLGTVLNIGVVWNTAGVRSVADMKRGEVVFGAAGPTGGGTTIPTVLNNLLGTKIRVVTGYRSQAEIYLALEKGEIAGNATSVWEEFRDGARAAWYRDGKVVILFQLLGARDPELPNVPTLPDLAENDSQRQVLRLMTMPADIGRSFFVAPEVPATTLAVLRQGFMAMTADPALLAEAKRRAVTISPMPGDKLAAFIEEIARTPKAPIDQLKAALQVDKAPAE